MLNGRPRCGRCSAAALPEALITRRGKAEFGRAICGEEARSFAEHWDETGADTALVHPELLRAAWRAPNPLFGSSTLLQMAWLADQATERSRGRCRPAARIVRLLLAHGHRSGYRTAS
jgi:hypothetical protein